MPEPDYLPTPEQIRKECERIRSEWTERDWENRQVRKPRPAETREVRTPEVPS